MKKRHLIAMLSALSLTLSLCGCTAAQIEERTDAQRFKDEYELVNDEYSEGSQKKLPTVSIPEDNPIVYKEFTEVCDMIDNGETFALYCGFATCPWCRACIETYLKCAENNGIDKIYYTDLYRHRDIYEYNENDEIECTLEASEGYFDLMERLDNVLDDYVISAEGKEDYEVGEKRIYAPNFIAVVDGKAVLLEESGDLMEDPYVEQSDEVFAELTERYNALFQLVK